MYKKETISSLYMLSQTLGVCFVAMKWFFLYKKFLAANLKFKKDK